MNSKDKEKILRSVRRTVAKKYGFKQYDYANWMVRDGYFFSVLCLDPPHELELEVKPLYVDNMFWDICDMASNKKKPMSLRAVGAFAVAPTTLEKYPMSVDSDSDSWEADLVKVFDDLFSRISARIELFLRENPDAYKYEITVAPSRDKTPVLMMLCRQCRFADAIRLIDTEFERGYRGDTAKWMPDGTFRHSYDDIRDYCLSFLK